MLHIPPSLANLPILRQRLAIEALVPPRLQPTLSQAGDLSAFLVTLAAWLKMERVGEPLCVGVDLPSGERGWHICQIWKNSGAQLYTWPEHRFLTLEIYTCKAFDEQLAFTLFTKAFRPEAWQVLRPMVVGGSSWPSDETPPCQCEERA